ncbi:V-type ATP synthase subunit I [Oxobacter pfennigii]|uniref:V-type ATP synthase subunit I n=1 Tax=Oxobacter pfennigii TaxID=36849 RepID=A0A0P8WDW0_9CLOT|nr:V-type ATPase 116kDa subunit family protein [Oxobacter pfennigii]KPU46247.1 V-type ATP synthase subunit I [Oxobacter pfennigii]
MSVEKMEMMNLIGYIEDLDKVSMEIVRHGGVHIVNAMSEINQNNFTIMTPEQDTNALKELYFIKPYKENTEFSYFKEKLDELLSIFKIDKVIKYKYINSNAPINGILKQVEDIHKEVMEHYIKRVKLYDEQKRIQEFRENIDHIKSLKIDFDVLKSLNFFSFKIGKLSKESYEKIKDNIENVSAIIYDINSVPGYQVIISLTPRDLEDETDKILKSLNYEELPIPYDIGGTPQEMLRLLDEKIQENKEKIAVIEDTIIDLKMKYANFLDECYSKMRLYTAVQQINNEVACTDDFFYMAGWVPVSEKKNLQKRLAFFEDKLLLVFKDKSEVSKSITPPTKLKNNWLVRPFEALVRMYGTPSYDEMDPTSFVAISYMIMFGAMFGDIGQGFLFFLAGIILQAKFRRPNLGGILSRVGFASMIFGTLFGSIFGDEEIIKPLLFHPLENINTILLGGVALGIIFTTVGFIYSLINALKRRDLEDGVFGKDGFVGLLFYWITILTAVNIYSKGDTSVPLFSIILMLCVLLLLMVFKQPIANLLSGHRPLYHEPMQDYYIESGFGVVETLLSMLSNTISFIRVGAFALNHVGLFVAFATIADMMHDNTASMAVMILGNIVIMALEGLIVFIQGLRLEYYELFSKYYDGSGIEYSPARLMYKRNAVDLDFSRKINYESNSVNTHILEVI